MRLIGRILLGIAAGLLLYSGITGIVGGINAINGLGGWGAVTDPNYWPNVFGFGFSILSIILGLPALFGVIRGKCGFWMFIFAALLGAGAGYLIYIQATQGKLTDAAAVWSIVLSLLIPITYALGTIFILLRRRGPSHRE